ncbi:MAG: hypothetical protein ANABAC_1375 [Anaerolineae bacterium]|nr:MAG: hypothetical protein ANABAC_1375 [Anaerolineae bacterium]
MNQSDTRLKQSAILKVGLGAMLAAVLANLLARFILGLLFPLSPDFQPFSYGAIVFFTVGFTLIGVIVLWVVFRLFANPLKVYNILAVVAFFFSLIPNFLGAANPSAMPMGGNSRDYLILILFHIVAAAAFLGVLNALSRPRGGQ